MEQPIKEAAAYIRVSTASQEELSPDAQKRLIMDYAKSHGFIITNDYIYIENGISGRKAEKRPEFMRMIAAAKSSPKPFDAILVWKFSRFARNQEESIVYKSLLKKQHDIEVISVSEPLVDGPFGSLIERIIEWMDEYYSIRLSGEVTRGMTEKALRGGYQARPPLGYKILHPKEDPVIVPEEAEIVKTIFRQYVCENKSIFEIAKYLNSLGLKTSRGRNFERRSIEYILQNPTYIGKIRWNRTENATKRIKDKDEWIVTDGRHEAIIPQELYQKALDKYQKTFIPRGSRPPLEYRHWLSGLIKCSACGRTLTCSKVTHKNHVYWNFQCYGYSKGKCNVSHALSAKKASEAVLNSIKNVLATGNIAFEKLECKPKDNVNETALIEYQLNKLVEKENRIKSAYLNGIDTIEEYGANKKLLLQERASLEKQLESLKAQPLSDPTSEREEMLRRVQGVYEILINDSYTFPQKSEALRRIISKIVFDKAADCLEIHYYLGG